MDPNSFGRAVQFVGENARVDMAPLDKMVQERGIRSLPSLTSPVTREAIEKTIGSEGLARSPSGAVLIDLGQALRNGWVEFWYQPKVDLSRRSLIGAEALARVRHPTHGPLPPASFLPNATPADIARLDLEAIRTALRDWDAIRRLNFNLRLTVNVKVGATQSERIAMLIETQPYGQAWPGLILDIDEADVVRSKSEAKAIQQALKPHGVAFAIDNVGATGNLAFEFAEIEFAELKLARRLIHGISTSVVQQAACQSYIDLRIAAGLSPPPTPSKPCRTPRP